jgi:predicted Rossmann fold nucleotide-binding protein DprA/Smf involved in DNA uptake
MTGFEPIPYDLEKEILGKSLSDPDYYKNVISEFDQNPKNRVLWGCGKKSVTQAVSQNENILALGFTGTQDSSNEGFRVTHLIAQVAAAHGICTIAGNAYGVDIAVMLGTLSRDEFSFIFEAGENPVHQIVALPSGIRSRAPRISYVEKGVYEDNGLYISLLNNDKPLRRELLSPRDRLIVELSDALIVTEAGNRGSFDTIIWAIETKKPILAIDWGRTDEKDVRSGCHILRELKKQSENPNEEKLDKLVELLGEPLKAQTTHYHFSSAHPRKRSDEVPRDGSGNKVGYQNPEAFAKHLLDKIGEYRSSHGPMINLVYFREIMPPHNGDAAKRERKARIVAKYLQELIRKRIESKLP